MRAPSFRSARPAYCWYEVAQVLFSAAALSFVSASIAAAGLNSNTIATLSWSATSIVSDIAVPSSPQLPMLYLRLEGAVSVKGAHIRLLWTPNASDAPGYALNSWSAPTAQNCTYLFRGTPVHVTEQSDSSFVAGSAFSQISTCTSGNTYRFSLTTADGSPAVPARIALAFVQLSDPAGGVDIITIGPPATVGNHPTEPAPDLLSCFGAFGWANQTTHYRLRGHYFISPVVVRMQKPSGHVKLGQVLGVSRTKLEVSFEHTLADTGVWHMAVANPGGRFALLDSAIRVINPPTIPPGTGGISSSVTVVLDEGTLPRTGASRVRPQDIFGGNRDFVALLDAVRVRGLACMWPSLSEQRTTLRLPDGPIQELFDFARVFRLEFDTPLAASQAIAALKAHSAVEIAVQNEIRLGRVSIECLPTVPTCFSLNPDYKREVLFNTQWGLDNFGQIGLDYRYNEDTQSPCAWFQSRKARGDSSITIAIVDTGIDETHPDLNYKYRFASNLFRFEEGHNFAPDSVITQPNYTSDVNGHGTQMAGIAAAITNNFERDVASGDKYGIQQGIAGVAGGWALEDQDQVGCRILPVRAIGDEGTFNGWDGIAGAINFAAQTGAKVINLSFEGSHGAPPDSAGLFVLRQALRNAVILGATCVAAMGNEDSDRPAYPAKFAEYGLCIAVGASDPCGFRATSQFLDDIEEGGSSFGPHIDIVAPGYKIRTLDPMLPNPYAIPPDLVTHDIEVKFGTSASTAFVSGVCGSLLSMQGMLRDVDIKQILRNTAVRALGGVPDIYTGFGRVDHSEAAKWVNPETSQTLLFGYATEASFPFPGEPVEELTVKLPEGVPGLSPTGTYVFTDAVRYEARFQVVFPAPFRAVAGYPLPLTWVRVAGSNGWSNANPHLFNYGWGEPVPGTLTLTGCTYRTYFYVIPLLGGWIPTNPANLRLEWAAVGNSAAVTAAESSEIEGNETGTGIKLRLIPNPVRIGTTVRMVWKSTGEDVPIRLAVYTTAGRLVASQELLVKGEDPTLIWDPAMGGASPLPVGIYLVHVRQGARVGGGKLLIIPQ